MAKKEGRLLTKKQKEERAAAEIRKKALLASGVQIEGLQQQANGGERPRKVVYGRKKKVGGGAKENPSTLDDKSSAPVTSAVQSPVSKTESLPPPSPSPAPTDDVKDDWDAESDPDQVSPSVPAEDVKSDWDASSDDESNKLEPVKVPQTPAPKVAEKPLSKGMLP